MSFDMRRRSEGTRKRGYFESSSLETSENNNLNHSSKAYAVHDSSYEDLDRLIMFITESKQIQGRYFVRYLPGMKNQSGELTPCNYRPTFSFSPPKSSATPTLPTPTNNRYNSRSRTGSLPQNNRSSLPDVVDLTDEDDSKSYYSSPPSSSSARKTKNKFFAGISTYCDGRRVDLPKQDSDSNNEDDDDNNDSSKRGIPSGGIGPIVTKKQTARKSMKSPSEILPVASKSPINKGSNDEGSDDQENNEHSSENTTKDTTADGSSPTPDTTKNNSNNNSSTSSSSKDNSNNISSNNKVNNISSPSSRSLNDKWNLLDGITVTVNPDFG